MTANSFLDKLYNSNNYLWATIQVDFDLWPQLEPESQWLSERVIEQDAHVTASLNNYNLSPSCGR